MAIDIAYSDEYRWRLAGRRGHKGNTLKVIFGYPGGRDRRSKTAKRLGLRYHVELQECPPAQVSEIAQALFRAVPHSTIQIHHSSGVRRSLQSWNCGPITSAQLHDYGAPVLHLMYDGQHTLFIALHRLDALRKQALLHHLEAIAACTSEEGIDLLPETTMERVRRRLSKRW